MKNLLPIGRFAQMCRLSIKTLRHYDELGVLKPAFVAPDSGYRYYDTAQVMEAERVRLLRSLEIPLEEVKQLAGVSDRAAVRAVLDRHRARMEEKLAETQRVLAFVERLLEQEGELVNYPVAIKEIAPQSIIYREVVTSLCRIGDAIGESIGALFGYIAQVGAQPAGPPGTLYLDSDPEQVEELTIRVYVPIDRPLSGAGELTGTELPGGQVAYTLHAGPFQEVGPAYPAVLGWVEANGYKVSGPAREVYLCKGATAAENRAEVAFPVTR